MIHTSTTLHEDRPINHEPGTPHYVSFALFYLISAVGMFFGLGQNIPSMIILGLIPVMGTVLNFQLPVLQKFNRHFYFISGGLVAVSLMASLPSFPNDRTTAANWVPWVSAALMLWISLLAVNFSQNKSQKNWAIGLSSVIALLVITVGLYSEVSTQWQFAIIVTAFVFPFAWVWIASQMNHLPENFAKVSLKHPERLTESQLIQIIGGSGAKDDQKSVAISMIESNQLLYKLFQIPHLKEGLKSQILYQVSDEDYLQKIVLNPDENRKLAETALGLMESEASLKPIAASRSVNVDLRIKALEKIHDTDWHFVQIANSDHPIRLRKASLKQFPKSDQLLPILLDKHEDATFRTAIFHHIDSIINWKDLYTDLPEKAVIEKIRLEEDPLCLLSIVKHLEASTSVRRAAAAELLLFADLPVDEDLLLFLLTQYIPHFLAQRNLNKIIAPLRYALHYVGWTNQSQAIEKYLPVGELLKMYQDQLPSLVQDYEAEVLDGYEQNSFDHELHYSVGNVFSIVPAASALKALQRIWVSYEQRIGQNTLDATHVEGKSNQERELGAAAILRALGACGAKDETYNNFQSDESLLHRLNQLDSRRKIEVRAFRKLSEEREAARKSPNHGTYSRSFRELSETMKDKVEEIKKIDGQIANTQTGLSPAHILRRVIADGQRYSNYIRQHALAGLKILSSDSFLDEESKQTLNNFIHPPKPPKEETFFFSEVELIPETQEEQMPISMESKPDLPDPEVSGYDAIGHEIRLFPQSEPGEIILQIQRGLNAIEGNISLDQKHLCSLVEEMLEEFPEAVQFLEQFPLKLMHPDQRKKMMGYYMDSGLGFEQWTRYTPPKDVGKVQKRYLQVRNLMNPNSMGINYQLFQNPLLLLPVLYHEYLHYEGIRNEAEVWLKEQLFLRKLIIKHSPQGQEYSFLMKLISEMEKAGDEGAKILLTWPLHNLKVYHWLNRLIKMIYGSTATKEEAQRVIQQTVQQYDFKILMSNRFLVWDPEVRWPSLMEPEGKAARELIEQITYERKRQNNFLNLQTYQSIIQEEENVEILNEWNNFLLKVLSQIPGWHPTEFPEQVMTSVFFNRA